MYAVGLDIGTTFTTVAVWRDGEVSTLPPDERILSRVLVTPDGRLLAGTAALPHVDDPAYVALTGVIDKLGGAAPIVVNGVELSIEGVVAALIRGVVADVQVAQGEPPAAVTICHPAEWGTFTSNLLSWAVTLADLRPHHGVALITVPEAVAVDASRHIDIPEGALFGVHDFGGRSFTAAVMRRTATGFDTLGAPVRVPDLGGHDLDQALLHHVLAVAGTRREPAPLPARSMSALVEECRRARSELLTELTTSVVIDPGGAAATRVEVTRAELAGVIRPILTATFDALRGSASSAGVSVDDFEMVLLIGGVTELPAVATMVWDELRIPPVVLDEPQLAAARGAAWVCGGIALTGSEQSPVPPASPTAAPGTMVGQPPAEPVAAGSASFARETLGTRFPDGAAAPVGTDQPPDRRRRAVALLAVAAGVAVLGGLGAAAFLLMPGDQVVAGTCPAAQADGPWVCVTSAAVDDGRLKLSLTTYVPAPASVVAAIAPLASTADGGPRVQLFGSRTAVPDASPAAVIDIDGLAAELSVAYVLAAEPRAAAIANLPFVCARITDAAGAPPVRDVPAVDCAPIAVSAGGSGAVPPTQVSTGSPRTGSGAPSPRPSATGAPSATTPPTGLSASTRGGSSTRGTATIRVTSPPTSRPATSPRPSPSASVPAPTSPGTVEPGPPTPPSPPPPDPGPTPTVAPTTQPTPAPTVAPTTAPTVAPPTTTGPAPGVR